MTTTTSSADPRPASPLVERFPALAALPRAALGRFPSPVERLAAAGERPALWLKRDDRDVEPPFPGGNKVRALEFLLGAVRPGDTVLTLGGDGSTHVLATAVHAARLGARTVALRWPHDMNPVAHAVAAEAARRCARIVRVPHAVVGLAAVALAPLARGARTHVVPVGGSTPLGTLGHVDAALELAAQIAAGALPAPRELVVPLGSGGTAAGLLLGLALAGLDTRVVGARVAPRIGTNRRRVLALADRTARLIERLTGAPLPRPAPDRLVVEHGAYGGAYGRPLPAGDRLARALADAHGLALDATYGAKGLAAAAARARAAGGEVLYWVTFDASALGAAR